MSKYAALVIVVLTASACSESEGHADKTQTILPGCPPANDCVVGSMRCVADVAEACVQADPVGSGSLCNRWAATACGGETPVCRGGVCASISARQRVWSQSLREVIDNIDLGLGTAPDLQVDAQALHASLESDLFHQPESTFAYFGVLRKALLAYPNGHLSLYAEGACGRAAQPTVSTSSIGACTQPYQDHAVVSFVGNDNPLGLVPGDEILSIDGKQGAEMLRASLEQPLCGNSAASESNRRYAAGTSVFATAHVGTVFTVKHAAGAIEQKTVGKLATKALGCRDPFGRPTAATAAASMRSDGVGIVRLNNFYSAESDYEVAQESVRKAIDAALLAVKDAHTVIFDMRANEGGSSIVGLELVAGLAPASRGKPVAGYALRKAGTTTYSPTQIYEVPNSNRFAYAGRVAMLIDGLSISAADYTALAAKQAGIPLIGKPSSGSYGGGVQPVYVGEDPRIGVSVDPFRGVDLQGRGTEGNSTIPDVDAELTPSDAAKGIDTALELGRVPKV